MVLHPLPSVRLDFNLLVPSTTGHLNLSGLTFTPDGRLWVISDETRTLDCLECLQTPPPQSRSKSLRPRQPYQYGNAQTVDLSTFFPDLAPDHEIDLEGIHYQAPYLWLLGSHSSKRKAPQGEDPQIDLKRLRTIVVEPNRYFLARIPWQGGQLHPRIEDPDRPGEFFTAARLRSKKKERTLPHVLEGDPHFGRFIEANIPSKDNGLDFEGLALVNDRLFLGLRGPVLRGYAALLDLTVMAKKSKPDELKLTGSYRKHFLNLQGLGVRDLVLWQDQLLILASPGPRWQHSGVSVSPGSVFRHPRHLPHRRSPLPRRYSPPTRKRSGGRDRNLTMTSADDGEEGETAALPEQSERSLELLVLYDAPHPSRLIPDTGIWADRFQWQA